LALTDDELRHLRRCVELATEALEAGDEPFGSVLVAADGTVGSTARCAPPPTAGSGWAAQEVVPGPTVQGPVPGLGQAVDDLIRRFHGAA
jgi:hypothetical protein